MTRLAQKSSFRSVVQCCLNSLNSRLRWEMASRFLLIKCSETCFVVVITCLANDPVWKLNILSPAGAGILILKYWAFFAKIKSFLLKNKYILRIENLQYWTCQIDTIEIYIIFHLNFNVIHSDIFLVKKMKNVSSIYLFKVFSRTGRWRLLMVSFFKNMCNKLLFLWFQLLMKFLCTFTVIRTRLVQLVQSTFLQLILFAMQRLQAINISRN